MPSPPSPLNALLCGAEDADRTVAFGRDGQRALGDLRARAGALSAHVAAQGPGRWLLHSEDSYAFAVGLFGLLAAGAEVVLPPNREPGTLARLQHELTGVVLDPDAPDAHGNLPRIDPLALAPREAPALPPLDRDRPCIHLSTSGTTGDGKAISKALRHLEDEVTGLEAHFGSTLGADARVFASVSPQHIYGLLFRVLWPLLAGRPFQADRTLHAEELLPRLAAGAPFVLASTPVHLRRLRGLPELAALRGRARAVFSSGGPMDAATAHALEAALGAPPLEIFGSTETGGIAWRAQRAAQPEPPWQPFAGVEATRGDDARLVVCSPFVSVGEVRADGCGRFATGDRARFLPDGSFHLDGRADRVVKIGEKRLSLPEMESQLLRHRFVAEVALAPFDPGAGPRVGAVVALSAAGRDALAAAGRRALGTTLSEHLAPDWDRVLLPRAWRYVDALPRDGQGKVPRAALLALLEEGRARAVVAPQVDAETRQGRVLEQRLRVPEQLAHLEGHYEGAPIVAGVVQIEWALRAARAWLRPAPMLRALEGLKFKEVLEPGRGFTLRLELDPQGDRIRMRLSDGADVFSEARLRLAEPVETAP